MTVCQTDTCLRGWLTDPRGKEMPQGVQPEGHPLHSPAASRAGTQDVGPVNQCTGDVIWL